MSSYDSTCHTVAQCQSMCTPHVQVRCTYLGTLCAPRIKTSVLTSESICTFYYLCNIFSRYTDPARFGRFRIIVSCDSYNVNVYNNLDIRRLSHVVS